MNQKLTVDQRLRNYAGFEYQQLIPAELRLLEYAGVDAQDVEGLPIEVLRKLYSDVLTVPSDVLELLIKVNDEKAQAFLADLIYGFSFTKADGSCATASLLSNQKDGQDFLFYLNLTDAFSSKNKRSKNRLTVKRRFRFGVLRRETMEGARAVMKVLRQEQSRRNDGVPALASTGVDWEIVRDSINAILLIMTAERYIPVFSKSWLHTKRLKRRATEIVAEAHRIAVEASKA